MIKRPAGSEVLAGPNFTLYWRRSIINQVPQKVWNVSLKDCGAASA